MLDPADFIRANTTLVAPPLVPEAVLHLATEVVPLWRKTEDELHADGVPPPYWAFAWAGGQALARHVLDNPPLVRGKRVLDFGSGSGLVAIAAAGAGAPHVLAADIDAFAAAAIALNCEANGIANESSRKVSPHPPLEGGSKSSVSKSEQKISGRGGRDLHDPSPKNSSLRSNFSTLPQGEGRANSSLTREIEITSADVIGSPCEWDVILVGDMCYERPLAERLLGWLAACVEGGADVLLGDPGRSYFPKSGVTRLATYRVATTRELEDREIRETSVYRFTGAGPT